MASDSGYHEPTEELSRPARDIHRALASLREEIEAIDWYEQRIDTTSEESLKTILAHNRDEEAEHVAMLLEWLRRRLPALDEHLRAHLFTSRPITEDAVPEQPDAQNASDRLPGTGLGIGRLQPPGT